MSILKRVRSQDRRGGQMDNTIGLRRLPRLLLVPILACSSFGLQADEVRMPEWQKIIGIDGHESDRFADNGSEISNGIPDYVDLYGANEVGYIPENISNGIGTDLTALLGAEHISDEIVFNGPVSPDHDLGDAYVMTRYGKAENLQIFTGVGRMATGASTWIEFEFNQALVHVTSGSPWPVHGDRTNGDLMVHMSFEGEEISQFEIARWNDGTYETFESMTPSLKEGCAGAAQFTFCAGAPPITHSYDGMELFDEDYNELAIMQPTAFVELGLDIPGLMGTNIEYSNVLIRTPQDIILNSYRSLGYWPNREDSAWSPGENGEMTK